jgi:sugar phosphate permease
MILRHTNIYYGWFVVIGSALLVFGITGGQFSFGVFLKPMTEEFGWSRATLSLAFGVTFMISGLLRPVAGYIADRYSPKTAAISGALIMGVMLLVLPLIGNLAQLYLVFAVMSVGITLGTGPILTKVVSSWFLHRRGLTIGLVNGASSVGGMILVPAATTFLVLFDWREAYLFLGLLLVILIAPLGFLFIRNRPEEMGLQPQGAPPSSGSKEHPDGGGQLTMFGRDATFREALGTPLFQRLTFGYFV